MRSPVPPPMGKTQPLILHFPICEMDTVRPTVQAEEVVKSLVPVVSLPSCGSTTHQGHRPHLGHVITINHQPLGGHQVLPHPLSPVPGIPYRVGTFALSYT